MYGGRSDSKAVTLAMERLSTIIPHSVTKEFPRLDHFGIERTAPREVAKAVSDYFLEVTAPGAAARRFETSNEPDRNIRCELRAVLENRIVIGL